MAYPWYSDGLMMATPSLQVGLRSDVNCRTNARRYRLVFIQNGMMGSVAFSATLPLLDATALVEQKLTAVGVSTGDIAEARCLVIGAYRGAEHRAELKRNRAFHQECGAVVVVLERYDEGAYGLDPLAVATEWVRHGYDAPAVDDWLSAGICDPDHADALAAAGYTPSGVSEGHPPGDGLGFTGWATDDAVADFLAKADGRGTE